MGKGMLGKLDLLKDRYGLKDVAIRASCLIVPCSVAWQINGALCGGIFEYDELFCSGGSRETEKKNINAMSSRRGSGG
jgi:hypothetical protein